MKKILCLFCLFILFNKVYAQKEDSLLNHNAPPIVFQDCLDKKLSPGFYKGKILVLDFWATWCAPCIAGFPHFNVLSAKFSSKDVVFAAITAEHATIAAKFFKRSQKQLKALKLSDTSRTTNKNFNIEYIPQCVVIDQNNVVKWEGQTYDLTEDILEKIIKNESIVAPVVVQPSSPDKPLNKPLADRALFSFIVAWSDSTKTSLNGGTQTAMFYNSLVRFSTSNVSLGDVLETMTGYSRLARIITNNEQKLNKLIDIEYNLGHDTSLFKDYANTIFKNAPVKNFTVLLLGDAFKFTPKIIVAKKKHYELIVADSAKLHSFRTLQSGIYSHSSFDDSDPQNFIIAHYNLKDIAMNLENRINTVIVSNIPDNTYYDFTLDITNIDKLNKSLLFQGLKINEVNDEVEMLNIEFY